MNMALVGCIPLELPGDCKSQGKVSPRIVFKKKLGLDTSRKGQEQIQNKLRFSRDSLKTILKRCVRTDQRNSILMT